MGALLVAAALLAGSGCGGGGGGTTGSTISGTLVDASNIASPIGNAYVYIPAAPPSAVRATAAPIADTTAGADGRFELVGTFPGTVTLVVVPPDLSAFPQCQFMGSVSDLSAAASRFPLPPVAWASRIASIAVTPSPVTVPTGGTQQFHAQVFDASGQLLPLTPAFTAIGAIGVLDDDGGLTAAGSPATGKTRATLGSVFGEANVTVSDTAPSGPRLNVSPGSLDFGSSATTLPLMVDNAGSGVLSWTAAGDRPWMSLSPASGTNAGTVQVTVSRVGLSRGTYAGAVNVSSPAGDAVVPVLVTVPNQPPVLASITASPNPVEPDGTATLVASASDADDDTLTYAWTVSGGTIAGSGSSVTWTPPTVEGTYNVTCSVEDGHGGTAQMTVEAVVQWSSGRIDVTIR